MIKNATLSAGTHASFLRKKVLLPLFLVMFCIPALAQVTLSTTSSFTNTEAAGAVTFNFQNTNTHPVIITDIAGVLADYGYQYIEIWYKNSAINGVPGNINVANGWTNATSVTILGIQNLTSITTQPLAGGMTITVPAGSTYGIAVVGYANTAPSLRIGVASGTVTVAGGGCNIITGTNIGYASATVTSPAVPTVTPRGFIGKVTFMNGANCTGTPNAVTISGPSNACSGAAFTLTAAGYSLGAGIGYQWQSYNTISGTWVDITGATGLSYTSAGITASTQFRLKTTCSSTGTQNLSNTFTVGISSGLAAGTYTINNNAPSTSMNFPSFSAAAAAMSCGIQGPVTINVMPGSGPYTESVEFNAIPGTSPVNKIRINGNGAIIQYSGTAVSPAIVKLKGTDYMTIDSLTVRSLSTDYGYGISLTDTSTRDSIMRCFVDLRSISSNNSVNSCGISLSGDPNYLNTNYGRSSKCFAGYNYVLGTNGPGGPYYGIMDGWYNNASNNYSMVDTGNVIAYNQIENTAYYGILASNVNGSKVLYNDIHRTHKTSVSTFVGIRNWDDYNYNNTTTGYTAYVEIVGNRIHNPSMSANSAYFYGIQSYNNNYYNSTAQANYHILIANNAIYNVNTDQSGASYGILFWSGNNINQTGVSETKIYHNTIDFGASTGGSGPLYGIYGYDYYYNNATNEDVKIKNNIVTIASSTTGAKYAFYRYDLQNTTPNWNLTAQRNNYYLNSPQSANQFYARNNNIDYPTMASFQAAYPLLEIGSLSVNPQYTSTATGDLTPLNYALYGNGTNTQAEVPRDILGRFRSATPTPGAFEISTDAGVSALLSPLGTYCSSIKQVSVSIVNAGITTINTVQVNWRLNGVLQTPVTYNGTLATGATAAVNLGNGLFMPNTPVEIKAWTSMPNNQVDGIPYNDTLVVTTQSSTSVPVNLGSDELICTGSTRTLDAGYPGAAYIWDNNSTAQTRTVSLAGTYYVKLTALDGCIGVDTFVLGLRPLPVVDLGPDREICLGQTTTFDAGHPGAQYLWDDGSTQQTYTVDTAGSYEVQVTDQFGCMGVDNVNVGMKDIPIVEGINATHADSGTYTFYPINPQYTISYRWNFGDGSPEVTGFMVQHTYTTLGIYTVTLYLEGECTGLIIDNSRTVDVFSVPGGGSTGIGNQQAAGHFTMFPNPARNVITIQNHSQDKLQRVVVYNALGQVMVTEQADNEKSHRLNLEGLANGLYTLRLETDKGYLVRKFEVMK